MKTVKTIIIGCLLVLIVLPMTVQAQCGTPTGLTISNISDTSASVNWSYDTALNGIPTRFVLVVTNTATDSEIIYYPTASDRSYTLTNLNSRTIYQVDLAVDVFGCSNVDTVTGLFVTSCPVGGEFLIGEGSETNKNIPIRMDRWWSISQQIFKAVEMDGIDSIFGIKMYMTSGVNRTRQLDIYVDTTSINNYSTLSDYITQDSTKMFFTGNVDFEIGWVEIFFSRPFVVPTGENIVITFNDHTGTAGGNHYFECSITQDNLSLYAGRNGNNNYIDPSSVLSGYSSSVSSVFNIRTNISFLTPCGNSNCLAPVITGTEALSTSVILHWAPGANTVWAVKYRAINENSWSIATNSTYDTFCVIGGLSPATEYVFRVYSICGGIGMPPFSCINATTPCANEAIPFFEDFESFTATTTLFQPCWYRKESNKAILNNSYYHNGIASLKLSRLNDNVLVLPQMDVPVDSLMLDFYCMTTGGDPYLEIGICQDPENESSYIVVDTISAIGTERFEWYNYQIFFDNYNGMDGRIYIRQLLNYPAVYIDDIMVDRIPNCREITSPHFENITGNSVTLSFSDLYSHDNYTIYYGMSDSIQYADSVIVDTNVYEITGLLSDTVYYFWIRGNCINEYGRIDFVGSAQTGCLGSVSITDSTPWMENFEVSYNDFNYQMTNCFWTMGDSHHPELEWQIKYYWNAVPAYSGELMAWLGHTIIGESMLILPTFDFSGITNSAVLSFYYFQYLADENPLKIYYRLGTSGEWIYITDIDTTISQRWVRRTVSLPYSCMAPVYQVAIKGTTGPEAYGVFVDDIRVYSTNSCFASSPTNVSINNITDRSATIRWQGTSPAYVVEYRPKGSWGWNTSTVEGQDSLNICPLEMITEYEVRVSGLCTAFERTDPSEMVSFTTEFCLQRIENNNFIGISDTISYNAVVAGHVGYSYAETLIDSATLSGLTSIYGFEFYVNSDVITPDYSFLIYMGHTIDTVLTQFSYTDSTFTKVYEGHMTFDSAGRRRVWFDSPYEWNGHDNLVIGVHKFYPCAMDTISYAAHVADCNKVYYGGKNSPFGLSSVNTVLSSSQKNASNVVPNLTLLGCQQSVCYKPVISLLRSTATDITLAWYNEGDAIEVEIKKTTDAWLDNHMIPNGHNHTFNALEPNTAYDIRLRRVCDAMAGYYSDWVVVHATTEPLCSVPTALAASDINATAATLAWSGDGSLYELHLWDGAGFDRYYDASASPFAASGLRPNSTYHASVRSICGTADYSDWSEATVFDNICHPATGVSATPNGDAVTVRWNAGERNQRWIVTYGYAGYGRNQRLGYMLVDTNVAVISGLAVGHSYGFRVVAVCGDDWQAGWTGAEVTATVTGEGIDAVDGSSVYLYPNPASQSVTIGGLEGANTVTVVDMNGRESGKWKVESGEFTIDLSGYAKGAYFVRITGEHTTAVRKLVVK